MSIASKLNDKFWQQHAVRYPSDKSDDDSDPFAMSPEEEAAWQEAVAKREAEQKAKADAEAAERRWWDRSSKILIGLLYLQALLATGQLVAMTIRHGGAS